MSLSSPQLARRRIEWPSACVPPAYSHMPEFVVTFGPEVADLCALANYAPDPEQAVLLDIIFALDENMLSAASRLDVICCRQNMKTGLFKQASLGWLFLTKERLITWSAHKAETSNEAHFDMSELVTNTPTFSKRLAVGPTNGIFKNASYRAIELASGARMLFKTRTNDGGRGLSAYKVILDEGFALTEEQTGSLSPTLSAMPDPQVLQGSSACKSDSHVLRRYRDMGRKGTSPRQAYAEWCAPQACEQPDCDHQRGTAGCACDKREYIRMANPMAGRRRADGTGLSWRAIEDDRDAMSPHEYGRERMGWHDDEGDDGEGVDGAAWARRADPESSIAGEPRIALWVARDVSRAAIAVAGVRADGAHHVEVTSSGGEIDWRPGVDWVSDRLRSIVGKLGGCPVYVLAGSQAENLAPALTPTDEDETDVTLVPIPSSDWAAASSQAVTLVENTKTVFHLNQPTLNTQISSLRRRNTEKGFVFSEVRGKGDTTAANAAILALYAARNDKAPESDFFGWDELA